LRNRNLWQSGLYRITDDTYDDILQLIETAETELMGNMIGQIIATIASPTDDSLLALDGQTVAVADYYELSLVVPTGWIVGPNIQLPDTNQSGLYSNSSVTIGDFLGLNEVTLTTDEIPSHTHTNTPHTHSEVIPSVTPTAGGEIPATASLVGPTPSTTGATSISIDSTGGGQPHTNVQRSLNINYFIVAQ
jgi:microcystin-dependent protein